MRLRSSPCPALPAPPRRHAALLPPCRRRLTASPPCRRVVFCTPQSCAGHLHFCRTAPPCALSRRYPPLLSLRHVPCTLVAAAPLALGRDTSPGPALFVDTSRRAPPYPIAGSRHPRYLAVGLRGFGHPDAGPRRLGHPAVWLRRLAHTFDGPSVLFDLPLGIFRWHTSPGPDVLYYT